MTSRDGTCPTCGGALPAGAAQCPGCRDDPQHTWRISATGPAGSAAEPAPTLDPEQRYEVLETLGRGASGTVYKVRDREIDEVIAIKVLDPLVHGQPRLVERFKQELKLARRIHHPNVARVFDLVLWRGRLAISQEFIAGQSLAAILARGPLGLDRLRGHLRYLASALDAAHRIGIVHRDLKPGNILVDGDDRPHIVDFGLAVTPEDLRNEDGNLVVGTPAYMAPEQARQPDRADPRSDLYSLGVVLFHMATGRLPFPAALAADLVRAHLGTSPPSPRSLDPSLPQAIDDVVLRLLEKDPARRYLTAMEVQADLEERLSRKEVRHPAGQVPPLARAPGSRGRVLLVDDDPAARAMLRAMLGALHVEAVEATNGMEGMEAALREKPDMVLLDILMPVLDGRETLRILHSNPATAAIPVVMLTGLTDDEEALASREMGARAFLNKPIAPDVLELLVERFLG